MLVFVSALFLLFFLALFLPILIMQLPSSSQSPRVALLLLLGFVVFAALLLPSASAAWTCQEGKNVAG